MTSAVRFVAVVAMGVAFVGLCVGLHWVRARLVARTLADTTAMLARALAADEAVKARVRDGRGFDEYDVEMDGTMEGYQVVAVELAFDTRRAIVSPNGTRVLKPSPLLLEYIHEDHGGFRK